MKGITRIGLALAPVLIAGSAGLVPLAAANTAEAATTAPPATCLATISHPNVSLHAIPQYQGYAITRTCGATFAAWDIVAADNYDHGGVYWPGGLYTDYYAASFDVGGHLGAYRLVGSLAYDASFNPVPQATEYFYIKDASRAAANGYRSGRYVYLRGFVSRFNPALNFGSGGFSASSGRYVALSAYYSGAWHVVGHRYTGRNGWTGYFRIYAPTHRWFRVSVSATRTIWNATSGSIYR